MFFSLICVDNKPICTINTFERNITPIKIYTKLSDSKTKL